MAMRGSTQEKSMAHRDCTAIPYHQSEGGSAPVCGCQLVGGADDALQSQVVATPSFNAIFCPPAAIYFASISEIVLQLCGWPASLW